MRRSFVTAGLAAALVLASAPAMAQGPVSDPIFGVWRNPKNSVHVEMRACGQAVCGYVVWASAKAQADAREGGTDKLVGLQLLRNFERTQKGAWRGKVFVPDLRATFSGTAELVDGNTLKAKGCLIAGLACKTQLWKRLDGAAD